MAVSFVGYSTPKEGTADPDYPSSIVGGDMLVVVASVNINSSIENGWTLLTSSGAGGILVAYKSAAGTETGPVMVRQNFGLEFANFATVMNFRCTDGPQYETNSGQADNSGFTTTHSANALTATNSGFTVLSIVQYDGSIATWTPGGSVVEDIDWQGSGGSRSMFVGHLSGTGGTLSATSSGTAKSYALAFHIYEHLVTGTPLFTAELF